MPAVQKIIAMRHPCVSVYRRSVRDATIQHQLPLTGPNAFRASATHDVAIGTIHTDRQISVLRIGDASGRYVVRVIVSSVTSAMTRIEKSAACTDSWPMKPLAVQAGLS